MGTSRVSPAHLELAREILAVEGAGGVRAPAAAARIVDRLHLHLDPLLGAEGLQALLVRSDRLSREAHPCLQGGTESAERLRACLEGEPEEVARAAVLTYVATFFSVITGFIGTELTAAILNGAWPTVAPFKLTENKP